MFRQKRLRSGHWIIVFGIFLAVTTTAAATLFVDRLYNDALAQTKSNLRNLTLILAEQTDRAFQSVEVVQHNLADRLTVSGVRSEENLRAITSTPAFHALLKQLEEALPHVEALSITDAGGRLLNYSRSWPPPAIDVSNREYFNVLKSDPTLDLVVSEPLVSKGAGTWTVIIARRIIGSEGQFIGTVVGVLKLEHFQQLYRGIDLTPDSAISLYRRDGVLLTRHPPVEPLIGKPFFRPGSSVAELLSRADEGTVRQVSPLDGQERIIAIKALQRYPIVLVASEAVPAVLSGWRREAALIALIALLMDFAVAAACLLGARQIKASARLAQAESYRARYDLLTGLPNRIFFSEELDRALARAERSGQGIAVLLLDLDRFKQVNDTLGHPMGDELLRSVAGRLLGCVRETDLIARIGGDEFAIIQKPVTNPAGIAALAARLLDAIAKPHDLGGHQLVIGGSIGAARAPTDDADPDGLLQKADLALYIAKHEGRGVLRFFEPAMEAKRLARHALERDLRQALEAGEFEVYYQPVLDLRTDRIAGFEALLRWQHAERGWVPPEEFIPLAEETGLIGKLGEWVLQQVCREALRWPAPLKVSVNVSPVQFRLGSLLVSVQRALTSSGLPGHRLELEITESVVLEDHSALATLHRIKALGVGISLDDFGTGYASMSYLRRFPFDRIKIDQSFVRELHRSRDSTAIVHATLDLARRLGMMTTAEGVEFEDQLNSLQDAGCTEAQGYFIARPMPPHEVATFLAIRATSVA